MRSMSVELTKVRVCIDRYDPDGFEGRLYHRILEQPTALYDVSGLLLEMDRLFDRLRFPVSSIRHRSFGIAGPRTYIEECIAEDRMEKQKSEEAIGKTATFIVQIQYRQNATWQGSILWAEKNERKPFRSALELIKLIDSAAEESSI